MRKSLSVCSARCLSVRGGAQAGQAAYGRGEKDVGAVQTVARIGAQALTR